MNDEKRAKLNILLFQLGELIKEPPVVIDHYDWMSNVEYVMDEIRSVSSEAYERLSDLVAEVVRQGEEHVKDLDDEEPPNVTMRSEEIYYEKVAFTASEINALKSL